MVGSSTVTYNIYFPVGSWKWKRSMPFKVVIRTPKAIADGRIIRVFLVKRNISSFPRCDDVHFKFNFFWLRSSVKSCRTFQRKDYSGKFPR